MESPARAVIALLLLAVAGCDRQSASAPQPGAEAPLPPGSGTIIMSAQGSDMPTEAFVAPDGKAATLSQFKGKPLLVNLWATWCGPCVEEMPSLDRLAARTGGKLKVLTISQDMQGAGVSAWWSARKLTHLEPYLDPTADLGFAYGGGVLPTTVLYDAKGKEVWRVIGGVDWDGPRAKALLADVLG